MTSHEKELALIEKARAKAEAVWLRCATPVLVPNGVDTRKRPVAARG